MINAGGTYALEDIISDKDERLISVLKNLDKYKNQSIKLLDSGCGLGRFLKQINKHYPEFELYGCDLSKEILNNFFI